MFRLDPTPGILSRVRTKCLPGPRTNGLMAGLRSVFLGYSGSIPIVVQIRGANPECFRWYEALEAGCIPVIAPAAEAQPLLRQSTSTFLVAPNFPHDVRDVIRPYLANNTALDALQQRVIRAWQGLKHNLQQTLAKAVHDFFPGSLAADPRSRVHVLWAVQPPNRKFAWVNTLMRYVPATHATFVHYVPTPGPKASDFHRPAIFVCEPNAPLLQMYLDAVPASAQPPGLILLGEAVPTDAEDISRKFAFVFQQDYNTAAGAFWFPVGWSDRRPPPPLWRFPASRRRYFCINEVATDVCQPQGSDAPPRNAGLRDVAFRIFGAGWTDVMRCLNAGCVPVLPAETRSGLLQSSPMPRYRNAADLLRVLALYRHDRTAMDTVQAQVMDWWTNAQPLMRKLFADVLMEWVGAVDPTL